VALGRHHRRPEAPLNLYLDASALGKLFLDEPGSAEVLEAWGESKEVACVSIGYVEVRSAIARRLAPRAASRARSLLTEHWREMQTVTVDDGLIALAVETSERHRLRALDALHLAAAEQVRSEDLVFATWDDELRQAARARGFATLPA
jgi:predicted nucleic acid-binding protein